MHRRCFGRLAASVIAAVTTAGGAAAYPGGTPDFQTDVAPFCAGCHASTTETDLAGEGEQRARAELMTQKHYAAIRAGVGPYAALSEAQREALIEQLALVDRNSTIQLEVPPQVGVGEDFQVTVKITGGGGPSAGVALVDRPQRNFARPATAVGWSVVGAPSIIGAEGPQTAWLARRPEREGREITFVNVEHMQSSVEANRWPRAKIIFTLRAPLEPGDYPIVGAYFYGTERATSLGTTTTSERGPQPLGGYAGPSGRVRFSEPMVITVKPVAAAPAAPQPAEPGWESQPPPH